MSRGGFLVQPVRVKEDADVLAGLALRHRLADPG